MKPAITRRKFLSSLALGTAGVVLAACQPTPTPVPPTKAPQPAATAAATSAPKPTTAPTAVPTAAPKAKVELRMGNWGGQARNELYNKICDLYQQKYPNVTIVRELAPWSDYWTKKATQAASGSLPDVTGSVIDSLSEYAKRGAYAPLDPYIEQKVIDISDWDPMVVNAGKVDGKVYSMASGVTSNCVIVNQDMIKRNGLQPPKFETTFAEFAELCRALQPKLGKNVWATSFGGGYSEHFQSWVLQKGYQICNQDATDVGFPKEVMIDFFKYWYDLYKAGVVIPIEVSSQPMGDAWADSFLAKRQVALFYINTNQLKIYQKYTKDDLVIMRNPLMPDGKHKTGEYLRPSSLSISTNSKLKDEAAKFVNFFVNDVEATKIFNMELGAVGPKHVQEALAKSIDPKDVLVLDHFNKIVKDIPPKIPDPKGTPAVLAAHRRAAEAIQHGTAIEKAVDTFMAEAKEAYAVNKS